MAPALGVHIHRHMPWDGHRLVTMAGPEGLVRFGTTSSTDSMNDSFFVPPGSSMDVETRHYKVHAMLLLIWMNCNDFTATSPE